MQPTTTGTAGPYLGFRAIQYIATIHASSEGVRRIPGLLMAGPVTVGNDWLNATVRLDNKIPISEYNRGDALRVNGENGRTITEFEVAIRRNPKITDNVHGFALQELAT